MEEQYKTHFSYIPINYEFINKRNKEKLSNTLSGFLSELSLAGLSFSL